MSNGLVERLHRQLKASIKSYPHPEHWTEALPLTLLGIRSSLKEDIGCTSAELVYGTTLRLPGEFFVSATDELNTDPGSYVMELKRAMQSLRMTNSRVHSSPQSSISGDLFSAPYVFVRHDAVRKPLQPPYDGPFKVLRRTDKYFLLDLNSRQDTVSVDRLKVAHLDPSTAVTSSPPNSNSSNLDIATPLPTPQPTTPSVTRSTRSGRHVHWPSHLASYIH